MADLEHRHIHDACEADTNDLADAAGKFDQRIAATGISDQAFAYAELQNAVANAEKPGDELEDLLADA